MMGMALILALESHHSKKFDRDRAVVLISEGTVTGLLPGQPAGPPAALRRSPRRGTRLVRDNGS
jgi:hypothetical protein